ncbi:MAG: acyltransferase family protein [Cellvibrionaceae bacterium]
MAEGPKQSSQQERLHALDAVRGIALLLGIVLHATMSFLPGLAAAGWPIIDVGASEPAGLIYYVIHIFRMATFFLVAGFFAHLVFHRRGMKVFLKDRAKRIVLPLVGFWGPLFVAMTGAIIWAVAKTGFEPPEQVTSPAGIPLAHLWFLYELVWLYAMMLFFRGAIVRFDKTRKLRIFVDSQFARVANAPWVVIVLTPPVAILLYVTPQWVAWEGVRTQEYLELPIWQSLLIYFYVFGLGWLLDRQRHLLAAIRRRWMTNLAIGCGATVGCLFIAGLKTEFLMPLDPALKPVYAGLYGLALVALSFAFIGGGIVLFSGENPLVRYLADASYWIYLMHIPLVMVLQALFMDWELHWLIKLPLIIVLTFIPLIFTYDWWVRASWLGSILNGRRHSRGLPHRQSAEL